MCIRDSPSTIQKPVLPATPPGEPGLFGGKINASDAAVGMPVDYVRIVQFFDQRFPTLSYIVAISNVSSGNTSQLTLATNLNTSTLLDITTSQNEMMDTNADEDSNITAVGVIQCTSPSQYTEISFNSASSADLMPLSL